MSTKKQIIIGLLVILFSVGTVSADYRDDSKAIKISGGEDYTLILTENNWLWACGDNYYYQLGIGDTQTDQFNPVRVDNGDMVTESGYLEDINALDAGWKHSLALDVNGFVWAWGDNYYGQLGDDSIDPCSIPIRVHDGDMGTTSGYLENIIGVACGRSGAHSLAQTKENGGGRHIV